MKQTIKLILILLFTYSSSLFAQQRGSAPYGIAQIAVQHADEINLTEDQKMALAELQVTLRSERAQTGNLGYGRFQNETLRGSQRNDAAFGRGRSGQASQGVRGERRVGNRGNAVSVTDNLRGDRFRMSGEVHAAVNKILTAEQMETLLQLRIERMESLNEFRALQQGIAIEKAELDPAKAERVETLMQEMNQLRSSIQQLRMESAGVPDNEKISTILEEIRTIQLQLRDELTVSEFRALQSAGLGRDRGNRSGNRGMMRNM